MHNQAIASDNQSSPLSSHMAVVAEADDPNLGRLTAANLGLDKVAYCINQTCKLVGISRPTFYRLVNRGELSTTKVGTRTLVTAYDIAEYLNRNRRPATLRKAA